jgi:hypothetical protein
VDETNYVKVTLGAKLASYCKEQLASIAEFVKPIPTGKIKYKG